MNKKFILRKNEEIQEVIKKSKKVINKYFVVYYAKNDKENNKGSLPFFREPLRLP